MNSANERLMELMDGWMDGELPEDEAKEFVSLLESSDEAFKTYLDHVGLNVSIREQLQFGSDGARTVDEVQGGREAGLSRSPGAASRIRILPVAAVISSLAAAAVVMIAFGLRSSPGSSPARETRAALTAHVTGMGGGVRIGYGMELTAASLGDRVPPGILIATDAEGRAELSYDDGTRLSLGSQSKLQILDEVDTKHLHLHAGALAAVVTRQPDGQHMAIFTPNARVEVVGTRFTLDASPSSTTVSVDEGRVILTRTADGASAEVTEGHYAVAAINIAPEAMPSPDDPMGHSGKPSVVFLTIEGNYRDDDRAIQARLEQLGLAVAVKFDIQLDRSHAEKFDLIFMSSCGSPPQIAPDLLEAAVPMVICDPGSFPHLALVEPLGEGVTHGRHVNHNGRLVIAAPNHPLAAGLAGTVEIGMGEMQLNWGVPGEAAIRVVASDQGTDSYAVFAYEKGAALPGAQLRSPARRVAFMLNTPAATRLNASGWRLFDAAVMWSLGDDGTAR